MSTAPSESKAPRQRKKLQCHKLAEQIHNNVMFFKKRLENNLTQMITPDFNLLTIDNIINQLQVLVSEVKDKCSIHFNLTENHMVDTYDGCSKDSLNILPTAMNTIKLCNSTLETGMLGCYRYLSINGADQILLDGIIRNCQDLLKSLNLDDINLRKITGLNYQDYKEESPTQPRVYFNPPLWGGRRSKSWRRKTIRRRNKKTKRRHYKSTRLY